MRISIVSGPLFPVPPLKGGATAHIWFGLAKEFARKGHQTTVISASHPDQPSSEVVSGVKFMRIGGFEQSTILGLDLLKDFFYAIQVGVQLPRSDILVINDFWLPFLAPLLKWKVRKALTIVGRFPKGQYRYLVGVDRIVVPSEAVGNALLAEAPGSWRKLVLIPHPVDTDLFHPPTSRGSRESIVLLYVGRVHPEKGIDLLLDAFSLVHEKYPNCYLQIVGPADVQHGGGGERYLDSLKQRAEGEAVEFCGPVFSREDLVSRYQQAQIFCYPSLAEKGEAFGLAPLEAMSCGVVPVVSGLECFRDHVIPDRTGLTFDHTHERAKEVLAEKIMELIEHPELLQRLSHSSREKALECSFSRIGQLFLDDFQGLLES